MRQYKVKNIKISRAAIHNGFEASLLAKILEKLDPETEILNMGESLSECCLYITVTNNKYGERDGSAYEIEEIICTITEGPGDSYIVEVDEGIPKVPQLKVPTGSKMFQASTPSRPNGFYNEIKGHFIVDECLPEKKCTCGIDTLGGGFHTDWCDKQ